MLACAEQEPRLRVVGMAREMRLQDRQGKQRLARLQVGSCRGKRQLLGLFEGRGANDVVIDELVDVVAHACALGAGASEEAGNESCVR